MNTNPQQQQMPEAPPEHASPTRGEPDPVEAGVPEAIQAADLARDQQQREEPDPDKPTRGVDWVRASDLLSRGSGDLSRKAIDFETRLARGARHGIATGAKHIGQKTAAFARKLPPLSAFGRDDQPEVEPRGMERA